MEGWIESLKARHREVFDSRDWAAHVRGLNARLGLTGSFAFAESRWAPEFFWAPLAQFEPGQWLAAASLNPKELSASNRDWHERQTWDADAYWAYHCREDLRGWAPADFYYRKWAQPFVLLLSELLQRPELELDGMGSYFSKVGAFEIIPYSSHQYAPGTFTAMSDDVGNAFAREVAVTAITECPPVAVVANGLDSAEAAAAWLPLDAPVTEYRYESVSRPNRTLRHWQSSMTVDGRSVPFAGFPFMRTQGGHNSYDEVRQLAREILARA